MESDYLIHIDAIHDEIMRQLDGGKEPTAVALWKWANEIKVAKDGRRGPCGTYTCPYCIVTNDCCYKCPFKIYGELQGTCMDRPNPFVSNLRSTDRPAWAQGVYDYIIDIAIAQAKEAVAQGSTIKDACSKFGITEAHYNSSTSVGE